MTERIWQCKIGGTVGDLAPAPDSIMRAAVEQAFARATGCTPQFILSGWGAELTDGEREAVERGNRE